jgi:hypothetical protein
MLVCIGVLGKEKAYFDIVVVVCSADVAPAVVV